MFWGVKQFRAGDSRAIAGPPVNPEALSTLGTLYTLGSLDILSTLGTVHPVITLRVPSAYPQSTLVPLVPAIPELAVRVLAVSLVNFWWCWSVLSDVGVCFA